jgi:hypothetical protein
MTISSTTVKNSYSGNGSTTVFAYTFKILDDDEIQVIIRSSTGTETVKTKTTHYTVSGVGSSGGGNITFLTAPTSTQTVVLRRLTTQTQETDYVANDPFPADSHEEALDRVTMVAQEIQEELGRAIKLSKTNTMTSTEFTVAAADRANKILAFDTNGEISVTQELGTYQGNWATATSYYGRDIIKDTSNNNIYICNTAHTSSGSQPISSNADTAKWNLLVDAASATNSANSASNSASNSSNFANTSANHASNSSNHASNSSNFANNSSNSANSSATYLAGVAANASNSSNFANNSSNSANSASNHSSNSSNFANNSSNSANTSSNHASNSSNHASNASNSANSASTSATTATTQAGYASSNASTATTQAGYATSNATAALGYSSNSSNFANNSSNHASNSSNFSNNSSNFANTASNAANAANSARDSALAAYDNFDDRYLGSKTSDPTLDNDGNALAGGALYFNSVDNVMKVYTGSTWVAAYASLSGALLVANNLSDLASNSSARTNLGLGTAATLNVGTSANNIVQLNGSALLPAVNGSQLTGLISTQLNANVSSTEFGYLDGVTSAIQTQIDTKAPTASPTFTTSASLGNQAEIRFLETTANGSNYVGFKAASTLSADKIWTLPSADGSANQAIITNGSGTLSFATISADGTADWDTSVKTTGFTATANKGYFCNTTSAAFTVTLPATPSAGDEVIVLDYAGTFDTNILTINPNSNKLEGGTGNLILSGDREGVRLVYIDATQGWLAYSGINEGTDALSPPPYSVNFLVVAGGAGGGANNHGAGGGAGGFRTSTQSVNIGTVITVTVGDGGAGGVITSNRGSSGSNSSISGSGLSTITSAGGGGGGAASSGQSIGGSGGSGGGTSGGDFYQDPGGVGNTPSTSPSQGNNGGSGVYYNPYYPAGGGGGAGAVGGSGTGSSSGGVGGNGSASSITGSSVTYAGGGGGSAYGAGGGTGGAGGSGGGGAGSVGQGAAGTANLGGGGGGSDRAPISNGGAGGKGVVILSVPTASYSSTTTGSPTVTTSGSNTILQFNGSGSYTG